MVRCTPLSYDSCHEQDKEQAETQQLMVEDLMGPVDEP